MKIYKRTMNALHLTSIFLALAMTSSAHADEVHPATLDDLNGIIAGYRCSGALVTFGRADSDHALVLAAGHCTAPNAGYPPGEAEINEFLPLHEEAIGTFPPSTDPKNLDGHREGMKPYWVRSVVYATQTVSDLAVYEIENTIGELKAIGLQFFELADHLPEPGRKLQITSGLWGMTQECEVARYIADNRAEKAIFGYNTDPFPLENSILINKGCTTGKGGWSGSPLVDPNTRLIYGVASRMMPGGENSRLVASNVVELRKCFDEAGKLALARPGCRLPRRAFAPPPNPKNRPAALTRFGG